MGAKVVVMRNFVIGPLGQAVSLTVSPRCYKLMLDVARRDNPGPPGDADGELKGCE